MMRYAGFWRRLGAGLVDFVLLVPFIALFIWVERLSRTAPIALQVPWALLTAAYNIYFHGRWGQSIGKMVAHIRVVSVSGDAISWKQVLLRFSVDAVLGVADAASRLIGLSRISPTKYLTLSWTERGQRLFELSPGDGLLVAALNVWFWSEIVVLLFNRRRRALHDFIAGTVVIHAPDPAKRCAGAD